MEKKRPGLSDMTQESDKQFLHRVGVTNQMQEVLTKIIENRPEDPIGFLADYFEMLGDKTDRVCKAHQQVCLTHHSKAAFHTNVRIAFDLLSQNKAFDRRGKPLRRDPIGRQLKGINGMIFSDLLNLLCNAFPVTVKEKLMKKIQCRDHEVVIFEVFKSGVFTCRVLQDFLNQTDMLFKSLDINRSGKVDRVLCDIITQQLVKAVSNTSSSNPTTVLDGGYVLAPDKLFMSIANSLFNCKGSGSKAMMASEDFICGVADAFLSKVQALK